jgi:hypothetical protein
VRHSTHTVASQPGRWLSTQLHNLVPDHHILIMPDYTIWCVVQDGPSSISFFSVKVATNEAVDSLKKAIRDDKKYTFDGVDPDRLKLYLVEISGFDEKPIDDQVNIIRDKLAEQSSELSPRTTLVSVFGDSVKKEMLIIVKPPPTPSK